MTFVKICGITNEEDALAAAEAGADMIGFIFAPSPREITSETAANITRTLPKRVQTVGVFTEESERVEKIADDCELSFVQLHGGQSEEFAARLGAMRVIRAVRVRDEVSINALRDYHNAAFYLLDAYVPGRAGGTGLSFDWELAREAEHYDLPVILAGGLSPDNIAEAVQKVRPVGVDVSSGVESYPGKKNHQKVKELINNVRAVDYTAR